MENNNFGLINFSAVPRIGRRTLGRLCAWLKENDLTFEDLWLDERLWNHAELSEKQILQLKLFQKKFGFDGYSQYLADKNIRVMSQNDKDYPILLKNIDDPPFVLYIKGNLPEQNLTAISVVGSRQMTNYGQMATQKIVTELVREKVLIVSGFMYGVDFCAHETALKQSGQTVGVLGFGFEHFYPSVYQQRYTEMLEKGMCFLSEYPPFARPNQGSFPERNRIVAGLSAGTVVIEAGENSGTLITARLAGEFGRSVFAVPASIFSANTAGTQSLINQGACLVSSGQEILEELGLDSGCRQDYFETLSQKIGSLAKDLIEELKRGPLDFERMSAITKLSTQDLNVTLMQLEINGNLERRGEVWVLKL